MKKIRQEFTIQLNLPIAGVISFCILFSIAMADAKGVWGIINLNVSNIGLGIKLVEIGSDNGHTSEIFVFDFDFVLVIRGISHLNFSENVRGTRANKIKFLINYNLKCKKILI